MQKLSRVTVTMEVDNVKYLRNLQSQLLIKSEKSVSFSKTLNCILRYAILNRPSLSEIKKISENIKS